LRLHAFQLSWGDKTKAGTKVESQEKVHFP